MVNVLLNDQKLSLAVSKETGLIISVPILDKNKTIPLDQQFYWYNGNRGHNSTRPGSGVYVFNPLNNSALPIKIETTNVFFYKGNNIVFLIYIINKIKIIFNLTKEI